MSFAPVGQQNPAIPFCGQIPGGMKPGIIIRVRGMILDGDESNRCTVDIQNTYNLEEFEDIMMHVSISPKENYPIVRNDYNNAEGGWGEEEVSGDNPVGQGQQFELTILAQQDRYLIAFNGQHFCEFQQRSPMNNGQFLAIRGECVIYEVQINEQ